jgi:hypothetical protein
VLALLLQRVLEGRLAAAGRPMTARPACFETPATCHLNRYEPNELLEFDYSITPVTQEQATILRAPGLTSLRNSRPALRPVAPLWCDSTLEAAQLHVRRQVPTGQLVSPRHVCLPMNHELGMRLKERG